VLITFSAVNRLTHHFRDPVSVAQSNYINDTYTSIANKPMSFTEVIATVDNPYEKFALLSDMCKKISEYHLAAMRTSEQYQVLSKKQTETELLVEANKVELDTKIEATDAKIDAHKVELETKIEETQEGLVSHLDAKIDASNGNLSLTPDQQLLFQPYFEKLKPHYGHFSALGMCKRAIKKQFVSPRTDGSWYHLRQRDLDDALEYAKRWKPTAAEMEAIKYKIRQEEQTKKPKKKTSIILPDVQAEGIQGICPKCGSLGVHKVFVPKIPFPFWKCDKCTWNVACEDPAFKQVKHG
jgi:hypothetical protein